MAKIERDASSGDVQQRAREDMIRRILGAEARQSVRQWCLNAQPAQRGAGLLARVDSMQVRALEIAAETRRADGRSIDALRDELDAAQVAVVVVVPTPVLVVAHLACCCARYRAARCAAGRHC